MPKIKKLNYAQVAFPLTSFRLFTYLIPVELNKEISIGSCVLAPIRHKERIGFVVKIEDKPNYDGEIYELKGRIEKDLSIPGNLWETLNWVSFYYFCSIGKVLKSAIPLSFKSNLSPKQVKYVQITMKGLNNISTLKKNAKSQIEILKALSQVDEPVRISSLKVISSSASTICKKLAENEYVEISSKNEIYNPMDIVLLHKFQRDLNLFLEIKLHYGIAV